MHFRHNFLADVYLSIHMVVGRIQHQRLNPSEPHLAAALVENLADVLIRLSAAILIAAQDSTSVGCILDRNGSIVQGAVGTVKYTVLVQIVGIEAVAREKWVLPVAMTVFLLNAC